MAALGRPAVAQEGQCREMTRPDHDGWHAAWRRADTLERQIEARLRDRGSRDSTGTVHVAVGNESPDPPIVVSGLDVPDSVRKEVEQMVRASLADRPRSEWLNLVYLNAPEVPLWDDRTEFCHPRPANDSDIRWDMRSLLHEHPRSGTEAFLARAKSAHLKLYVNWEGQVTLVEVISPTGDAWLDDHLEELGKRMEFRPATLNGVPVGRWIDRTVNFKRNWELPLDPRKSDDEGRP